MVDKSLIIDISVRLDDKKHLKTKLKRIAKNNHLNLNQLMIYIIEWFLEAQKDEIFSIKLK